eukprot:g65235.t1
MNLTEQASFLHLRRAMSVVEAEANVEGRTYFFPGHRTSYEEDFIKGSYQHKWGCTGCRVQNSAAWARCYKCGLVRPGQYCPRADCLKYNRDEGREWCIYCRAPLCPDSNSMVETIAIVVPFFNEECSELRDTLVSLHQMAKKLPQYRFSVLLVSDGWFKTSASMRDYLKLLFPEEKDSRWSQAIKPLTPGRESECVETFIIERVKGKTMVQTRFNGFTSAERTELRKGQGDRERVSDGCRKRVMSALCQSKRKQQDRQKRYEVAEELTRDRMSAQWDMEQQRELEQLIPEDESFFIGDQSLYLTLLVKRDNRRKHNSHDWFLAAFAQHYSPKYVFLTDCGTTFDQDCMFHLVESLEVNPDLTAVTARNRVMTGKQAKADDEGLWARWYRAVQAFETEQALNAYAGAFSMLGLLPVIPGPCGLFRWEDIQEASHWYLRETSMNPDEVGLVSANLLLVEDRILSYGVVLKAKPSAKTAYDPRSSFYFQAETDPLTFFQQRRRWINGSNAGYIWLMVQNAHLLWGPEFKKGILFKAHLGLLLTMQVLMILLGCLAPGLFIASLHFALPHSVVPPSMIYFALYALFSAVHTRRAGPRLVVWLLHLLTVVNMFCFVAITIKAFNYLREDMSETLLGGAFTSELLTYIVYGVMSFPLLIALLHDWRSVWIMLQTAILFYLFLPTMVVTLPSYAYARVWELSWGNRPSDALVSMEKKKSEAESAIAKETMYQQSLVIAYGVIALNGATAVAMMYITRGVAQVTFLCFLLPALLQMCLSLLWVITSVWPAMLASYTKRLAWKFKGTAYSRRRPDRMYWNLCKALFALLSILLVLVCGAAVYSYYHPNSALPFRSLMASSKSTDALSHGSSGAANILDQSMGQFAMSVGAVTCATAFHGECSQHQARLGQYACVFCDAQECCLPVHDLPQRPDQHISHFPSLPLGVSVPSSRFVAALRISNLESDPKLLRSMYWSWKDKYLKEGECAPNTAHIQVGPAHQMQQESQSIAQGYAMLLTAFFAGEDAQAQRVFDELFRFTRLFSNPDSQLMHRRQVDCKNIPWLSDMNQTEQDFRGKALEGQIYGSVTQADMDIAYALLLADAQWGGPDGVGGTNINYRQEAAAITSSLFVRVVNDNGVLLLGDWVKLYAHSAHPLLSATRTADFLPDHLRAFANVATDSAERQGWLELLDKYYVVFDKMIKEFSPARGLLPEYILWADGDPVQAPSGFENLANSHLYGAGAAQMSLRVGLDYLLHGEPKAQALLSTSVQWFAAHTYASSIDNELALRGREDELLFKSMNQSTYQRSSVGTLGPLTVATLIESASTPSSSSTDSAVRRYLDALVDAFISRPFPNEDALADSIAILSALAFSGNWWSPALVGTNGSMKSCGNGLVEEELGEFCDFGKNANNASERDAVQLLLRSTSNLCHFCMDVPTPACDLGKWPPTASPYVVGKSEAMMCEKRCHAEATLQYCAEKMNRTACRGEGGCGPCLPGYVPLSPEPVIDPSKGFLALQPPCVLIRGYPFRFQGAGNTLSSWNTSMGYVDVFTNTVAGSWELRSVANLMHDKVVKDAHYPLGPGLGTGLYIKEGRLVFKYIGQSPLVLDSISSLDLTLRVPKLKHLSYTATVCVGYSSAGWNDVKCLSLKTHLQSLLIASSKSEKGEAVATISTERCGTSWIDAESKCGKECKPLPHGCILVDGAPILETALLHNLNREGAKSAGLDQTVANLPEAATKTNAGVNRISEDSEVGSVSAGVAYVLEALAKVNFSAVLVAQQINGQMSPSRVYTSPDLLKAVRTMAETGVGNRKLWLGDGSDMTITYGLVNIAAFLSQAMKESIMYDACDENNWDLGDGGVYPASNACGQLGQSYQDYKCSAEEKAMECPVDPALKVRATTFAPWYGAPPPLFCAPKSLLPESPAWNPAGPWCNPNGPQATAMDVDQYIAHLRTGQTCLDYPGQRGGQTTWKGGGYGNQAAPAFERESRTNVEGCCWWGRGVLQLTGICNMGKLNWHIGAKAFNRTGKALYPNVDFCKNPGAICDSREHPELKWVSGLFYWVNLMQEYRTDSWSYIEKLKQWVDAGMPNIGKDSDFIHAVSGIVNRGCHNPPCQSGGLDGGPERALFFKKVLDAFGLGSFVPRPTTPAPPNCEPDFTCPAWEQCFPVSQTITAELCGKDAPFVRRCGTSWWDVEHRCGAPCGLLPAGCDGYLDVSGAFFTPRKVANCTVDYSCPKRGESCFEVSTTVCGPNATENKKWRCGKRYEDANSKCGDLCAQNCNKTLVTTPVPEVDCDEIDYSCKVDGERCYPVSLKSTLRNCGETAEWTFRCGSSWQDVDSRCGSPCGLKPAGCEEPVKEDPCKIDYSCASKGELCFPVSLALTRKVCQPDAPFVSRCGTSWQDVATKCGQPCGVVPPGCVDPNLKQQEPTSDSSVCQPDYRCSDLLATCYPVSLAVHQKVCGANETWTSRCGTSWDNVTTSCGEPCGEVPEGCHSLGNSTGGVGQNVDCTPDYSCSDPNESCFLGLPSAACGGTSKATVRCGQSYKHAAETCGELCGLLPEGCSVKVVARPPVDCNLRDFSCPDPLEKCFLDLDKAVCTKAPNATRAMEAPGRCGRTYLDAQSKCGSLCGYWPPGCAPQNTSLEPTLPPARNCAVRDFSCADPKDTCYVGLSLVPCGAGTGWSSARCGRNWSVAFNTCGPACGSLPEGCTDDDVKDVDKLPDPCDIDRSDLCPKGEHCFSELSKLNCIVSADEWEDATRVLSLDLRDLLGGRELLANRKDDSVNIDITSIQFAVQGPDELMLGDMTLAPRTCQQHAPASVRHACPTAFMPLLQCTRCDTECCAKTCSSAPNLVCSAFSEPLPAHTPCLRCDREECCTPRSVAQLQCTRPGMAALTFDTGLQHSMHNTLLSYLARKKIAATFFVHAFEAASSQYTGAMLNPPRSHQPDDEQRVAMVAAVATGHTLGSLGFSAESFQANMSEGALVEQLYLNELFFSKEIGVRPRFFRSPNATLGSARQHTTITNLGFLQVLSNLDVNPLEDDLKQLETKLSALNQSGHSSLLVRIRADVLDQSSAFLLSGATMQLVERLEAAGYTFVPLHKCLEQDNYKAGDIVSCQDQCDEYGTSWKSVLAGFSRHRACPKNQKGEFYRRCGMNGEWERTVYTCGDGRPAKTASTKVPDTAGLCPGDDGKDYLTASRVPFIALPASHGAGSKILGEIGISGLSVGSYIAIVIGAVLVLSSCFYCCYRSSQHVASYLYVVEDLPEPVSDGPLLEWQRAESFSGGVPSEPTPLHFLRPPSYNNFTLNQTVPHQSRPSMFSSPNSMSPRQSNSLTVPDAHGGRRYSTLEWPDQIALEWACFYMWREEPALTDEQIVDFLRQQGWTWIPGSRVGILSLIFSSDSRPARLVPGSQAGCANKIPLDLNTWMNRILKTGTAVGRGKAGEASVSCSLTG